MSKEDGLPTNGLLNDEPDQLDAAAGETITAIPYVGLSEGQEEAGA